MGLDYCFGVSSMAGDFVWFVRFVIEASGPSNVPSFFLVLGRGGFAEKKEGMMFVCIERRGITT